MFVVCIFRFLDLKHTALLLSWFLSVATWFSLPELPRSSTPHDAYLLPSAELLLLRNKKGSPPPIQNRLQRRAAVLLCVACEGAADVPERRYRPVIFPVKLRHALLGDAGEDALSQMSNLELRRGNVSVGVTFPIPNNHPRRRRCSRRESDSGREVCEEALNGRGGHGFEVKARLQHRREDFHAAAGERLEPTTAAPNTIATTTTTTTSEVLRQRSHVPDCLQHGEKCFTSTLHYTSMIN